MYQRKGKYQFVVHVLVDISSIRRLCNSHFFSWFIWLQTAMPGMKRDCGGAAAILGAFYATIKRGFSQNLHAVFCLAENAVGPKATKPDDIHTLFSGR